jgi:HlyD family secretion protein
VNKRWWWVVVIVLVASGGWWYLGRGPGDIEADPLVRSAVVERGDLVVSISATGVVDPFEQVDVKSKASGEITELPIQEGDVVRRGDLIARLDPTTARNDYEQAEADFSVAKVTLEQRQTELKRQQDLFDRGLASRSELDNARLAHEQANAQRVRAQANLSTAQERLDDTEIRAPIDGVVLTRPVEIGQIISSGTTTVTGGTLLCTIASMDQVFVVADVDETDIGRLSVSMTAEIQPEAYPERSLTGRVLRIAPLAKVQQNVTMFEVTCLVDNSDGALKAGMNATVEVILARADDALLIPARAVEWRPPAAGDADPSARAQRAEGRERPPSDTGGAVRPPGGGPRSWVQVRREGTVEVQPVRTGLANLDQIEILKGLSEGDTVIYQLVSGVMRSREEFRERMRSRSSVSNMRRTR